MEETTVVDQDFMAEHDIGALLARIDALSAEIRDVKNTVAKQGETLNETHDAVVGLQSTYEKPGDSKWCDRHMTTLNGFEREMREIRDSVGELSTRVNRWAGAFAVIVFILQLFGPSLRSMFQNEEKIQHNQNTQRAPVMYGDTVR